MIAWVFAACGGRQRAPTLARETLVAIEIEGTKAIPVEEIAPGLAIERARGARAVDPYQLSTDTERVRAAYRKLGYFDVVVDARVETKGFAQTVVFRVIEGPRSTLKVEITGLPPEVPFERARALIDAPDGAPFDYEIYDAAKEPMIKLLEDAGYANVDIQATVLADRTKRLATARFAISPGDRARFGDVVIEGAGNLEEYVRGRLEFGKGDVYTQKALAASQRSIYDLNRFTSVRIEPDRSQGAVVPIKITVVRASSGELRYGVGAGIDPLVYEVRARGGIGFVPDSIPLWTFGIDLRPSVTRARDVETYQFQLRATAFATRMELFGRPRLRLETDISYDFLRFEGYTTRGPRGRVALATPLGPSWLQGRLGWLLEYQTFTNVVVADPVAMDIGLDEAVPQRRGAYELSLVADGRDNPLDVRNGWYATIALALGTPWAGGDGAYQKIVPEVRRYYPIGPLVLAGRLRFGFLFGDVPVTERFFSGGATTQRGFDERRLSPIAPTIDGANVVIGGVGLVETGIEARFPIVDLGGFPLVTALFIDGADVVTDIDMLPLVDQQWAAGFGLYIKLFGLKVGASIGERLNRRQPNPDGEWFKNRSWHIAVGDTY
ncbi:MAG: outer membrane protein assembly factor [Kofleriaceae bacterium]